MQCLCLNDEWTLQKQTFFPHILVVSWCCTDAPNMTSNIIEILKY